MMAARDAVIYTRLRLLIAFAASACGIRQCRFGVLHSFMYTQDFLLAARTLTNYQTTRSDSFYMSYVATLPSLAFLFKPLNGPLICVYSR